MPYKEAPDEYILPPTPLPERVPDVVPQPYEPEISPPPLPIIDGILRKIKREEDGNLDPLPEKKPTIH